MQSAEPSTFLWRGFTVVPLNEVEGFTVRVGGNLGGPLRGFT
jgi:hypothetical protein